MNIRSLGFRDTRERVILLGVDITEFRVYCVHCGCHRRDIKEVGVCIE